jgi:hypothetical protein
MFKYILPVAVIIIIIIIIIIIRGMVTHLRCVAF